MMYSEKGHQSRNSIWLVIAALLVVAGLSLHAEAASAKSDKVSVVFVSGPLSDNFFPPMHKGAEQAAKQLGIDFKYLAIDESDIETSSARTMKAAIARDPDAIVVGDFIPHVVDPLIKKAVNNGIAVYVDQSGISHWKSTGAFGYVGQEPADVGVKAARILSKSKHQNLVCVINVPNNPYLQNICNGMIKEGKKRHVSVSKFELPTADSTNENKVTRDLGAYLQTHRKVDGMLTLNSIVASAAVKALHKVHRSNQVAVGNMGVSKANLQELQQGQLKFIINEQPYLEGYYAVLFAYQYVKYGLAPVGYVATGPKVIDQSNVKKMMAVFKKYPNVLGTK